ncbi:CYTH and CHAD domain-containing protein [Arthrobacter sp. BE255]|uniref:CYTH and CHAD domain-containing protein n=1 Tax=Arthrobacter sp. BE255 TaxID=2817721 RepID=UPI0028564A60|nr:CYTH and CHAD domain-containing protein [Arthrobacter sp. BE255]MDR7157356.1 CHAD domain-containing protein [Arthrobacter sp. BE255]
MVSQGVEIEKKYDVGEAAEVPSLTGVPGVARVGEPRTATLDAVYFDTGRHTLASRRMTLRRRTGDADAGWHLKLPAEAVPGASDAAAGSAPQQRRELHEPLGQADVVPDRLLAHLRAYLRGDDVAPVVRLETRRTTYPLYAEDGVHLADLADDRVSADLLGTAGDSGTTQRWREWELELVHGSPELFPAADDALAAAGASPAEFASKLARALAGGPDPSPHDRAAPAVAGAGRKSPATAVVTAYLGAQIQEILARDPGVRLEEPEAVHEMRSATRRARSVLSAYRQLYSAVAVRRLCDELKWLGQILGEPRDAEVMLDRLRGHIDDLEPGPAATAVKAQLEKELGDTLDAAYRKVQGTLLSERYYRLLDDLERFRDQPPARPEADAPARKVAGKLVGKAAKRLRLSHRAAKNARRGAPHESALHQVRKDAKKVRHVAESMVPVHGKRAVKAAKAAHRLQQALGDFHDGVIARDLLAEFGAVAGVPEPIASAYITLQTRQVQLAAEAEAKYVKAWKKSKKRLKAGVL